MRGDVAVGEDVALKCGYVAQFERGDIPAEVCGSTPAEGAQPAEGTLPRKATKPLARQALKAKRSTVSKANDLQRTQVSDLN